MDIFGNNPNDSIIDGTFTNSTLTGSTTVVAQNGETYNLQTPNNGNNLDVLTTDGVGSTYWAPSGGGATPTLQEVYDASGTPIAQVNISYGNKIRFRDDDGNDILAINSVATNNSYISGDRATITTINSTINNSDSFVKNGGTSNQYLMADGTSLAYSQNSGNSNFYLYNSIDNITTPPPLSGKVGYNNANQSSATILYINHLTSDGIDIDVFFAQLTLIQDVYLQDKNTSVNFIRYNITGTPTIIANSYISIPVQYTASIPPLPPNGGGTGLSSFGVNHPIIVSFFTNSIEVDTRLSTLETKTQNQSAIPNTTTFSGSGGILASKLDIATAGTLILGTVNTTAISIGKDATATSMFSNLRLASTTNSQINPQLDTNTSIPFFIGSNTCSGITLGRNTTILTIPSNIQLTATAPAFDCGVLNTALLIGNTNAGAITIGRTGQTVSFAGSIAGSLTVATSVLSPLFNPATAVSMSVGSATHTGLTVGRTGANSLIQGLAILNQQVPFISTVNNTPTAVNSRLTLSKFIMPTNLSNSTSGTFIMTGVAGSMGSVNTLANEQIVGSAWRIKFSGNAANAVNTNTLSFQITHGVSLTQTIATWTYTNATTGGNFNAEIILFFSVIGATSTVVCNGYVNFVNGTTASILNVGLNSFSPVYNSTIANANGCQIVASPASGFLYGVNNFTVEWLR